MRHLDLFLGCLLFITGGAGGRFIAWRRFRRKLENMLDDEFDRGYERAEHDMARAIAEVRSEGVSAPVSGAMAVAAVAELERQDATMPGRTIYPELAALAAESDPEPRTVLDPHWYAKRMHEIADWHLAAQADAQSFTDWLPGYLDWYRGGLEPRWSAAARLLEAI